MIKEGCDKANETDREWRNVEEDRHIKEVSSSPPGSWLTSLHAALHILFSEINSNKGGGKKKD